MKQINAFRKKNNSGITLIALVVTIIILVILAGISMNMLFGENGIIKKASLSTDAQVIAKIKEDIALKRAFNYIEGYEKGNGDGSSNNSSDEVIPGGEKSTARDYGDEIGGKGRVATEEEINNNKNNLNYPPESGEEYVIVANVDPEDIEKINGTNLPEENLTKPNPSTGDIIEIGGEEYIVIEDGDDSITVIKKDPVKVETVVNPGNEINNNNIPDNLVQKGTITIAELEKIIRDNNSEPVKDDPSDPSKITGITLPSGNKKDIDDVVPEDIIGDLGGSSDNTEWEFVDNDGDFDLNGVVSVGDLIRSKNKDLSKEEFYVINVTDDKVTLMSKYNLNITVNDNGHYMQLENGYNETATVFSAGDGDTYSCYWSWQSGFTPYMNLNEYTTDEIIEEYSLTKDNNAILRARDYASLFGGTGRLPEYNEVNDILNNGSNILKGIIKGEDVIPEGLIYYWIASTAANTSPCVLFYSGGSSLGANMPPNVSSPAGIRPIVEIPKNKIISDKVPNASEDNYRVGQEIIIRGEKFYVIKNGPVKALLLAEKNINVTTNKQTSDNNYVSYDQDDNYYKNSDIKVLVDNYVSSLKVKGAKGGLLTIRHLKDLGATMNSGSYYGDAGISPNFLNDTTYWLKNAGYDNDEHILAYGWRNHEDYEIAACAIDNATFHGLRPTIEVLKDNLYSYDPSEDLDDEDDDDSENSGIVISSGIDSAIKTAKWADSYGVVSNYRDSASSNIEWKLFYADDDNVYLISSELIDEGAIVTGGKYTDGSKVSDIGKTLNSKYIGFKQSNTNKNIQAVAWLTDTEVWSNKYVPEELREDVKAIGGPTIELFEASWNAAREYDDANSMRKLMDAKVKSIKGYDKAGLGKKGSIKVSYNNGLYRPAQYQDNGETVRQAYLLASPSSLSSKYVRHVNCYSGYGYVNSGNVTLNRKVRPIIILPSNMVSRTGSGMSAQIKIKYTGPAGQAVNVGNYGKKVTNYTAQNLVWRLFYEDANNIYLISETSDGDFPLINVKACNYQNYQYSAIGNYTSGAGVSAQGKALMPMLKQTNLLTESNKNINILATAYLADTSQWDDYVTGDAAWAMGGPTIELFVASFNATMPYDEHKIVLGVGNYGYTDNTELMEVIRSDRINGIYNLGSNSSNSTWVIGPGNYDNESVMVVYDYQKNFWTGPALHEYSARPVVCIPKSTGFTYNLEGTVSDVTRKGDLFSNVSIGDRVGYNPTNNYSYISETGTGSSHGSGYRDNQTFTSKSDLKWKVLSKNEETREIVLICESSIKTDENKNYILNGAVGYLYAEEELNRICSIYGHGFGANTNKQFTCEVGDLVEGCSTVTLTGSGARSMTVDDLNNYVGVIPTSEMFSNWKYGEEKSHTIIHPTRNTESGHSNGTDYRTETTTIYYCRYDEHLNNIQRGSKEYYAIFGYANAQANFWLSSRCVQSGDTGASYFVRYKDEYDYSPSVGYGDVFKGYTDSYRDNSCDWGERS